MRYLRQSTSVDVPIGPFVDAADGVTAEGSLTITQPDVRLKKGNGNWAQKAAAQTLSHEENGYYEVTLDATDTNTIGLLRLAVAESGALPVWEDFHVLDETVYDVLFGTVAPATATNITAGTITTATNVTTVNGLAAGVITAAAIATDAIDADALADGAITAATFAAGAIDAAAIAADAIGSSELAASAVTEIQSGLSTLTEAGVRTAVGLASANLDTQLSTIDTVVDSILADTGTDGVVISAAQANAIADALLDRVAGVETNRTPRQALRLILAACVSKLSGAATSTVTIRDTNDTKDRVTATVDASGNRTAVTLDGDMIGAARYFPGTYFAPRYFPKLGGELVVVRPLLRQTVVMRRTNAAATEAVASFRTTARAAASHRQTVTGS